MRHGICGLMHMECLAFRILNWYLFLLIRYINLEGYIICMVSIEFLSTVSSLQYLKLVCAYHQLHKLKRLYVLKSDSFLDVIVRSSVCRLPYAT